MNIRQVILQEFSKKQATKIADYVGNNPVRFKVLIDVFLKGPYRISQRASVSLNYCVDKHPALIRPHLKRLISYLRKKDADNSIKRNTLRLFQFIEVPRSLEAMVAGLCFQFLQNRTEPIAVRVFAMTVLANISNNNPELKNELKILIEDGLVYGSAAFRSRGRKILKNL